MHRLDEGGAREFALQAAELLGGDDDDLVASVHRHMLRTFAAHTPDQFTEAGFSRPAIANSAGGDRAPGDASEQVFWALS